MIARPGRQGLLRIAEETMSVQEFKQARERSLDLERGNWTDELGIMQQLRAVLAPGQAG